jgi:peptidoglycan/LPS O-acetylase OafA/YrhL
LWIAWSIALVLIALILFVSYLSFTFIENPARRWLNSKAAAEIPKPSLS